MVLRNCLGMIMSVSTLIILSGAATPSSVVNLCMAFPGRIEGQRPVSERAPSFVKGSVQLPMLGYEVGPTRPTEKGGITMLIFNGLAAAAVIGLGSLLLSAPT